jgi:hypothetical protein
MHRISLVTRLVAGIGAVAATAAACGSSSNHTTATTRPAAAPAVTTTTLAYRPTIDPARFVGAIDNRYFPLKPGTTLVYEGTRDGRPQHNEMVVTSETKKIMGVTCVVVRDTVTVNGAPEEKTTDWYAQDVDGNVWYFGEDTKEYVNGNVSSTKGSWEAGVDNAQPGMIMEAIPKSGDVYRQEYRPGEAEDSAKVLRADVALTVPAGSFTNVVLTEDTDPLNPSVLDRKHYAPGAGMISADKHKAGHDETLRLAKITTG